MSILDRGEDDPRQGPTLTEVVELLPTLVYDDPVVVATLLADRYGDVVRVPPLHPALDSGVYLLSNPEDVRSVLQSDPSEFRALDVPGSRDFSRVVKNSTVSLHSESEEGSWIKRLRLVGPEFRAEEAESQVPGLAETTLATIGEFAGSDAEGSHDGPDVGVDSAINLQPDRDVVVRFVPRETP